MKRAARGLGAIAALVVLVLLALLAAAVLRYSTTAQSSAGQSLQAARASYAARAGIDWGLYQVLKGSWVGCSSAQTQTLDLRADTGMRVTVRCTGSGPIQEGESAPGVPRNVRIYQLESWACNGAAASCPDNAAATGLNYVERYRRTTAADVVP
jgi:MSHA biogenesis protein MshP